MSCTDRGTRIVKYYALLGYIIPAMLSSNIDFFFFHEIEIQNQITFCFHVSIN